MIVSVSIVVGATMLYALVAGFAWVFARETVRDGDGFFQVMGCWFWPLVVPVLTVLTIGRFLVFKAPEWIVERVTRPRLPKAQVRR